MIDIQNKTPKILVIGDLMVDHYLWGSTERISPEAPVQVVNVETESILLGGAGNVINNLNALGSVVDVISVIGECETSEQLKDLLSDKFVSKTVEAQIIQSDLIYLNRFSPEDVELISKLNSEYLVDDEKEILYESIFDIKNLLLKSKGLPYEDHNQLKSDVLQINHPIDEKTILKFISENPGIERLKGWISDTDKNTWLVQKTRSECNFSISNYETISRLVVIYKDKINLETLGI